MIAPDFNLDSIEFLNIELQPLFIYKMAISSRLFHFEDVETLIKIYYFKENGAKNVEYLLSTGNEWYGCELFGLVKSLRQSYEYFYSEQCFPYLYAIDLLKIFISQHLNSPEKTLKLIRCFRIFLVIGDIKYSNTIKKILNIFYYILYVKNPYHNNKNLTPEQRDEYQSKLKRLAQYLLYLIMFAKQSDIETWNKKSLLFIFMLMFDKKEPYSEVAESKWAFVSNWWQRKVYNKDYKKKPT